MKRFLIIDGSALLSLKYYGNLPISIKYAKEDEEKEKHYGEILQTSTGIYTNGLYGVAQTMLKIIRQQNPEYVAFVFDKSRNTFRKRIYDGYKATRHETPAPLKQQFIETEKMLANMGFKVFVSNEYEADDLAGSLAARFENIPNLNVTLMTKDFDYVQLLNQSKNTTVWMIQSGKGGNLLPAMEDTNCPDNVDELDEKSACERYDLPNAKTVIDFKALAGDKSDNIPGVKGVGDESAKKLISKYLTIESLYEDIQIKGPDIENRWKEELDLRKGYYKKLIAEKDNAFLSKKLATIKTDIQLGYQLEDFICPTNWEKFDQQFKKYEMSSLRVELAKMQ